MCHGGIGRQRQMRNLIHCQLVSLQQPVHDLVDRSRHGALQLLQSLLVLAENDPGDDIIPIADLTVVSGGVAKNFPLGQIHQLDPDRGGADIYGKSKVTLGSVAGLNVQHVGKR